MLIFDTIIIAEFDPPKSINLIINKGGAGT